jgi:DNA-binding CsgD family transcriptional regulator
MVVVRQHPTRRQLEVLRVYIDAGSVAAAAHELDIAPTTVREHLSELYRRTGCANAAQAAYRLACADLAASGGNGVRAAFAAADRRPRMVPHRPALARSTAAGLGSRHPRPKTVGPS